MTPASSGLVPQMSKINTINYCPDTSGKFKVDPKNVV